MIPVVVVEVPASPPTNLQTALLRACSSALPRGRCRAGATAEGDGRRRAGAGAGEKAVAVAVLTPADEGGFRIEVALSSERPRRWVGQDIDFAAADPLIERYRAAGFAIAALVSPAPEFAVRPPSSPTESAAEGATEAAARKGQLPTGREAVSGDSASAPPGPERGRRDGRWSRYRMALRGTFGGALDDGSGRTGLAVEPAWRPLDLPVYMGLTAAWSIRPSGDQGLRFSAVAVGVPLAYAVAIPATDAVLEARVGPIFEWVRIGLDEPGFSDWKDRWMSGVIFGACAGYPARGRWALQTCAEGLVFEGSTGIEVDGARVGAVPAGTYRLSAGATLRL